MREDNFIEIIKSLLPESSRYIGDDTAYVAENDLIATQDTLIEDVHFRIKTISPFDLGIKSMAVNLSDIAAAGGIPKYALISLSLPENIDETFVKEFYSGITHICKDYSTIVIGGDLTKSSKITIAVTLLGNAKGLLPAKRCNSKAGEVVIITGNSGSSRAGLWILEEKLKNNPLIKNIPDEVLNKFIKAHINPIPKVKVGREILKSFSPLTMMDTSDGLADALYKISKQSNVSMEIDLDKVPFDSDLSYITEVAAVDVFKWVLYGGEDYELVATIPFDIAKSLIDKGLSITIIGKVINNTHEPSVFLLKNNEIKGKITSNELNSNLYSHFG